MKYILHCDFPLIKLAVAEENGKITNIFFENDAIPLPAEEKETPLLARTRDELCEYFAGRRKSFDIPLAPAGTQFQQLVWAELLKIPYGRTACYGDIAAAISKPRAARAVGMANHRNPIPIIIPCHRVIAKDGGLAGYGGGVEIKEMLLALEAKHR